MWLEDQRSQERRQRSEGAREEGEGGWVCDQRAGNHGSCYIFIRLQTNLSLLPYLPISIPLPLSYADYDGLPCSFLLIPYHPDC